MASRRFNGMDSDSRFGANRALQPIVAKPAREAVQTDPKGGRHGVNIPANHLPLPPAGQEIAAFGAEVRQDRLGLVVAEFPGGAAVRIHQLDQPAVIRDRDPTTAWVPIKPRYLVGYLAARQTLPLNSMHGKRPARGSLPSCRQAVPLCRERQHGRLAPKGELAHLFAGFEIPEGDRSAAPARRQLRLARVKCGGAPRHVLDEEASKPGRQVPDLQIRHFAEAGAIALDGDKPAVGAPLGAERRQIGFGRQGRQQLAVQARPD